MIEPLCHSQQRLGRHRPRRRGEAAEQVRRPLQRPGLLGEPGVDRRGTRRQRTGLDPALRRGTIHGIEIGGDDGRVVLEPVEHRGGGGHGSVILLLFSPTGVPVSDITGLAGAGFGVGIVGFERADVSHDVVSLGFVAGDVVAAGSEHHQGNGRHGVAPIVVDCRLATASCGPLRFVCVVIRPFRGPGLNHCSDFCSVNVNLSDPDCQAVNGKRLANAGVKATLGPSRHVLGPFGRGLLPDGITAKTPRRQERQDRTRRN